MTHLETIRQWVMTYPEIDKVKGLGVDYYSEQQQKSSLAPAGLLEISRREDILGNITVENQYNFSIVFAFNKSPDDDVGAIENAEFVLGFQQWVQDQSIRRLVPTFGNDPKTETVKAQNGELTFADQDGTGYYTVLLSINFTKIYKET